MTWREATELTPEEVEQIQHLKQVVEQEDGIPIAGHWYTLTESAGGVSTRHMLCDPGGGLVGYVGVTSIVPGEVEVWGMVAPPARRRGLFRSVVERIASQAQRTGDQILCICDRSSETAAKALQAIGARWQHAEHEMRFAPDQSRDTRIPNRLDMQLAEMGHLDVLTMLDQAGFGDTAAEAAERNRLFLEQDQRRTYIAWLNDVPVGKIGLYLEPDKVWLYGFCVHPRFQGQGYGREILQRTVSSLRQQGVDNLLLNVSVDNRNALTLYESCGFVSQNTTDFYRLKNGDFHEECPN